MIQKEQYKIGWRDRDGRWKYLTVGDKSDMLAEVADKSTISDRVTVRVLRLFTLREEEEKPTW